MNLSIVEEIGEPLHLSKKIFLFLVLSRREHETNLKKLVRFSLFQHFLLIRFLHERVRHLPAEIEVADLCSTTSILVTSPFVL